MRISLHLIAVGCLVLAAGCGSNVDFPFFGGGSSGSPGVGAVAVIDLDAIARRLGRDRQMSDSIQQREASLNQQLGVIKASYEKQISEKQSEIGASPTPEQAEFLSSAQRQATVNLNQVLRQARNDLGQHSAQLIQRFREEVRPIARQVASEKGLSVIVTKNDSVVFDYDTAVDITDAVAERMVAQQSNSMGAADPLPMSQVPPTAPVADRVDP